jgi:hypothetical protein
MGGRYQRYSAHDPFQRHASKLIWIGLNVLLFGSGPLITICVAASLGWTIDPNPNPVFPKLLALFTFWPGVALMIAGAISTVRRRREARS